MSSFRSLFLLAICAPVFAQTDAITVTATRTIDLSPEQITFSLAVVTDPAVSLDQVLQAMQPLGLDASKLTTINLQPSYGPGSPRPSLNYVFTLTTAFSKFGDTNDKMAALRRTLSDNTPSMDLQVYAVAISPTDASLDQARQNLMPQLIADAKRRGDLLAKAAGVNLGAVLGVTENLGTPDNTGIYYGPFGPSGPSSLHTAYSLSVRFAVK